jgi:hypothetical protein
LRIAVHKQTYSDGRAYRYHVSGEAGDLRYVAEPTGLLLPSPTRLVEFFDPHRNPVGRLQPSDGAGWRRAKRYDVSVGEEMEEPYAVIWERLRLVDVLLLRLPRYEVQLGQYRYVVRGSRYGERFYEIFHLRREEAESVDEEGIDEEEVGEEGVGEETEEGTGTYAAGRARPRPGKASVGQIQRPTAGPSYIVETDAAPLCQALIVLAALVILVDMALYA